MKNRLVFIGKILIVSIVIGLFISLFQFLAHEVIHFSNYLMNIGIEFCILTITITIIVYIGIRFLNIKFYGYYGSGVPRIEAYYNHNIDYNPYKMIGLLFINSLFAFFTGFLLGSEGPSISMATSIGKISNNATKSNDIELEAASGSAGFACAFMSPLAGLCHLIEENRKMLSIKLILKGLAIISISFIISYFVFPHNILPYYEVGFLPFKFYLGILVLIPLLMMVSKIYTAIIVFINDISKKFPFMYLITPVLIISFMILRRFCPVLSGNGSLALELDIIDYSLIAIIGVMLFRLLFTGLSASAYVSGGLVLPMLAVGALCGFLVVKVYSFIDSSILDYTAIFISCGMVAMFGITTKCPITAFVLGLKCASVNVIVLPMLVVVGLTGILTYLFKYKSIYHHLEKRVVALR